MACEPWPSGHSWTFPSNYHCVDVNWCCHAGSLSGPHFFVIKEKDLGEKRIWFFWWLVVFRCPWIGFHLIPSRGQSLPGFNFGGRVFVQDFVLCCFLVFWVFLNWTFWGDHFGFTFNCKKWYREIPCVLHPLSPTGNTLQNSNRITTRILTWWSHW